MQLNSSGITFVKEGHFVVGTILFKLNYENASYIARRDSTLKSVAGLAHKPSNSTDQAYEGSSYMLVGRKEITSATINSK